jgi:hypothetical protein
MATDAPVHPCDLCRRDTGGPGLELCCWCEAGLPDVRLTFGKHKGRRVADVPRGYLRWLLANVALPLPVLHAARRKVEDGPKGQTPGARAVPRGRRPDRQALPPGCG